MKEAIKTLAEKLKPMGWETATPTNYGHLLKSTELNQLVKIGGSKSYNNPAKKEVLLVFSKNVLRPTGSVLQWNRRGNIKDAAPIAVSDQEKINGHIGEMKTDLKERGDVKNVTVERVKDAGKNKHFLFVRIKQ